MKKFYLLLGCVLCSSILIGQPTLQYPQNTPVVGDVTDIDFVSTNGISPGATGPDVTWDFSGLTSINSGQITAIEPSAAPAGFEFPESNVALNMGDTIYTYLKTNTDGYYYLGSQFTTGTYPALTIYSNSRTFLKFPFTYDDTYFDTYKGVITTSMGTVHVNAATEMFSDAYGTLVLPTGTFTNVLRIMTVDVELDSVFIGGVYIKSFDLVRTQFSWFTEDSKGPLMSIEIMNNEGLGSLDTVAYYMTAGTGISDRQQDPVSQLHVFPNPANDHVMVEFEISPKEGASISIVNQVGQVVINRTATERTNRTISERIDISALPAGIYFAHISCECGKHLTEKFVIR